MNPQQVLGQLYSECNARVCVCHAQTVHDTQTPPGQPAAPCQRQAPTHTWHQGRTAGPGSRTVLETGKQFPKTAVYGGHMLNTVLGQESYAAAAKQTTPCQPAWPKEAVFGGCATGTRRSVLLAELPVFPCFIWSQDGGLPNFSHLPGWFSRICWGILPLSFSVSEVLNSLNLLCQSPAACSSASPWPRLALLLNPLWGHRSHVCQNPLLLYCFWESQPCTPSTVCLQALAPPYCTGTAANLHAPQSCFTTGNDQSHSITAAAHTVGLVPSLTAAARVFKSSNLVYSLEQQQTAEQQDTRKTTTGTLKNEGLSGGQACVQQHWQKRCSGNLLPCTKPSPGSSAECKHRDCSEQQHGTQQTLLIAAFSKVDREQKAKSELLLASWCNLSRREESCALATFYDCSIWVFKWTNWYNGISQKQIQPQHTSLLGVFSDS